MIWKSGGRRSEYADCLELGHCDSSRHSLAIHLHLTREIFGRGGLLACHLVATRCHYQQLVFGIPIACHLLFISAALSDIPSHTFADVKMWMQTLWREMFTRSTCQILTRELSLLIRGNDEDRQAKFPCKWFYNWEPFLSPSSTQTKWNEVQEVSTWICVNSKRRLWQCHGGGKVRNV